MSSRRIRYFNRNVINSLVPANVRKLKTPRKNKTKQLIKINKNKRSVQSLIEDHGLPYEHINNPRSGQFYVNLDTGDTYLFAKQLGWLDINGWQPDVGEGAPDEENPANPLSGDQYLNIFTGDLYVFNEGFGWILQNAIEGPPGPAGESFSFELETITGPTGPTLSGSMTVNPGQKVKLWIKDSQLYADVI